MSDLKHNIVSILYAIKEMIGSHLIRIEEGNWKPRDERLQLDEMILRKSHAEIARALEIIKRITYAVRTTRGERRAAKITSLKETWRKTTEALLKEFPSSHIEYVDRIPADFPPIHVDQSDLEEILYHIAHNAVQAMKHQGKIILRAQLAFLNQRESHAIITISDTGHGISDKDLPYLFEPFFTTKSIEEGNGLGLYLTKELVTKNGGTISVSSFESHGTTFTLQFHTLRSSVHKETVAL